MIKTFRGQLADGGQDRIRLQTIKGKVGYRIVKFEIMPYNFNITEEYTCTVWKSLQSTLSVLFNFTDSDLLAAAYFENTSGSSEAPTGAHIIFDNEVFNQDIYIINKCAGTGGSLLNYYLELEVIPLTDHDAEFTTLKDIRGRNTT